MIDTYKDIFNKRANSYHEVMTKYPDARDKEFANLIQYYKINKDDKIADMPSGGCYLKKYLDKNTIFFLDPAQEFLHNCSGADNTMHTSLENTPFKDSFFDKIYSLAGSHHIDNKKNLYKEVYRVLKKDAHFIYGDVLQNSKEDTFLNVFVNKYNSSGHTGIFLNNQTKTQLADIGFKIEHSKYIDLTWNFKTIGEMIDFIKKLFGLDLATDEIILQGIDTLLGYKQTNNKVLLNWGLFYIFSKKS